VTQRRLRPVAAIVALALAVAACGSDDDSTDTAEAVAATLAPAPPATDATDATDATGDGSTRTIDHVAGTTEVPADPERIVTTSEVVAGHLVSVGVLPIGGPDEVADWLQTYADAGLIGDLDLTEIVGIYGAEANLERLAQLDPDLILIEDWELELYDSYAAIAPTVVISRPTNADWKDAFDQTITAAGREEEAAPVRERYEALLDEVGPDAADTLITFLRGAGPGQFRIDALGGFGGSVAEEAGFGVDVGGVSPDEATGGAITFSNEQLDVVTGDLIVTTTQAEGGPSNIDELKANPLWENIPAVADANIVELPQPIYNGGTYLAAQLLLEALLAAT
jgi:iron complex transport system substrate-binding protein